MFISISVSCSDAECLLPEAAFAIRLFRKFIAFCCVVQQMRIELVSTEQQES